MLNVYCFKWGDRYGPEYVNRLYASFKIHYDKEFIFHCITDDPQGIYPEVRIIDYGSFATAGDSTFTVEKLELMHRYNTGNNLLLDLDILIHANITDVITEARLFKPTFIYTHWTPEWHWDKLIDKKSACFLNSSFVYWSGSDAAYLYEHYRQYDGPPYDSCDKFIFYEFFMDAERRGMPRPMHFWHAGIFYNYNEEGPMQYKYQKDHKACLFNTSHLIKMDRRYYELDNTPNWATDLWESYDEQI